MTGRHRWWLAVVLGLAAFATGRATAHQATRGWSAYDGREWAQFAPREKQAYVAGFLAGGALADAERIVPGDSGVLRRGVDSLYRAGALRFGFGHMVYANQLDEFYWWENHIPVPLYLALRDVNRRLQRLEP
ncbi:MAG: hypothetical protein ACRD08_08905 [Acidimicrobiales bacterium]